MRLLSLDFDPVYGDDTTRSTFSSDVSAFDYDVVIWDPEESLGRYGRYSSYERYRGLPSFDEEGSVRLTADAARRRQEFVDFINTGRSLVVIVRPPQLCVIDTGQRSYSGTGRNRVTTRHVQEFDLLSALPVSGIVFQKASGSRIEIVSEGPAASLLKKYRELLRYEATMAKSRGTSLAKVTRTDRIVSSLIRTTGGGNLVLLPLIDLASDSEDDERERDEGDDGWIEQAPEFQADLLATLEELSTRGVTARPAWAKNYATEQQRELITDIATQQERVEKARARLAKLHQERERAEARDQLFLGTGRALELQVREVLELLGGTVIEPPPGRDDWRVDFPEGAAVLEIKGVLKSAAEKHAAQLEKWVASAFEDSGEMPKGILVVNTWREVPLGERTQEDFPSQMLPYSKRRGHCLITGLQLFVIRADVEGNPDRAERWRKLLLSTKGIVAQAKDWRKVIQETKTAETEDDDAASSNAC
jgi:hypothetical protein